MNEQLNYQQRAVALLSAIVIRSSMGSRPMNIPTKELSVIEKYASGNPTDLGVENFNPDNFFVWFEQLIYGKNYVKDDPVESMKNLRTEFKELEDWIQRWQSFDFVSLSIIKIAAFGALIKFFSETAFFKLFVATHRTDPFGFKTPIQMEVSNDQQLMQKCQHLLHYTQQSLGDKFFNLLTAFAKIESVLTRQDCPIMDMSSLFNETLGLIQTTEQALLNVATTTNIVLPFINNQYSPMPVNPWINNAYGQNGYQPPSYSHAPYGARPFDGFNNNLDPRHRSTFGEPFNNDMHSHLHASQQYSPKLPREKVFKILGEGPIGFASLTGWSLESARLYKGVSISDNELFDKGYVVLNYRMEPLDKATLDATRVGHILEYKRFIPSAGGHLLSTTLVVYQRREHSGKTRRAGDEFVIDSDEEIVNVILNEMVKAGLIEFRVL